MKSLKNNQGTTLIEVLVSLVLVAITALGGIALYFNASELQSIVIHKKRYIEMANSKMEECRRSGCATMSPTAISPSGLDIADTMEIRNETSAWAGYDAKVVSIDWNETGPTSRDFNVSFTTLIPQ